MLTLPKQYHYGPSTGGLVIATLFFGTGAAILWHISSEPVNPLSALDIRYQQRYRGAMVLAGLGCLIFLCMLLMQWTRKIRTIELGPDALIMPKGLMGWSALRIPYTEIASASEIQRQYGNVAIQLIWRGQKITIYPAWLPDNTAYTVIRDFLTSAAARSPYLEP